MKQILRSKNVIWAMLLLLVTTVGFFSSCGGKDDPAPSVKKNNYKVVITVEPQRAIQPKAYSFNLTMTSQGAIYRDGKKVKGDGLTLYEPEKVFLSSGRYTTTLETVDVTLIGDWDVDREITYDGDLVVKVTVQIYLDNKMVDEKIKNVELTSIVGSGSGIFTFAPGV